MDLFFVVINKLFRQYSRGNLAHVYKTWQFLSPYSHFHVNIVSSHLFFWSQFYINRKSWPQVIDKVKQAYPQTVLFLEDNSQSERHVMPGLCFLWQVVIAFPGWDDILTCDLELHLLKWPGRLAMCSIKDYSNGKFWL